MSGDLQHPLANLLANVVDDWFRYYGCDEAQAVQMRTIIDEVQGRASSIAA